MQIHHSGKELIKGKQIQTKLKINNKLSFTLVTNIASSQAMVQSLHSYLLPGRGSYNLAVVCSNANIEGYKYS